ncbi:uncharacterized protein HaLaN_17168 [Haematococcus lacustris]|uniref:Uncharacterized protein n=1 Tax=Haematococcus lacustris TaxID=44745 RepID=A0A699ZKH1_HAELA|nr:uncharacterized protein HaLaN_17168 [Haematococcus lacustris]
MQVQSCLPQYMPSPLFRFHTAIAIMLSQGGINYFYGLHVRQKHVAGEEAMQLLRNSSESIHRLTRLRQGKVVAPLSSRPNGPRARAAAGNAEAASERLSSDEVEDIVESAAAFVSIVSDLRPISAQYNAFAEVWKRLAEVPQTALPQLLKEVEPGALRGLWKASMSRYVLDDDRANELMGDFNEYNDFPATAGEVRALLGSECSSQAGICTMLTISRVLQSSCCSHVGVLAQLVTYHGVSEIEDMTSKRPPIALVPVHRGSFKHLQPRLEAFVTQPVQRRFFQQVFFRSPTTGLMFARTTMQLVGPVPCWWQASYCAVNTELVLTPSSLDAGADITCDYTTRHGSLDQSSEGGSDESQQEEPDQEMGGQPTGLSDMDLPSTQWPWPPDSELSPITNTQRDYIRIAGPGVYVGCGYTSGDTSEDAACTTFRPESIVEGTCSIMMCCLPIPIETLQSDLRRTLVEAESAGLLQS